MGASCNTIKQVKLQLSSTARRKGKNEAIFYFKNAYFKNSLRTLEFLVNKYTRWSDYIKCMVLNFGYEPDSKSFS
jgi:hypothetical protein